MYNKFLIILLISIIIVIFYNVYQNYSNNTILNTPDYSITPSLNLYKEKVLSENPKIIYLHNFITPDEADFFKKYGDQYKKPSTIDTKDGGPVTLASNVRSSESAHLTKQSNPFVQSLENKAANYFNSNISHLEPLQVVVYEKGQKYIPHHDFFDPNTPDVKVRGNRSKTILVYLNDVPEEAGGATFFPKINLKVQPAAYDAIYFENINNGELDYNTLHSGEPLLGDVKKYAINIWVREKDF
jgi:prolyl 4-hydroxylase